MGILTVGARSRSPAFLTSAARWSRAAVKASGVRAYSSSTISSPLAFAVRSPVEACRCALADRKCPVKWPRNSLPRSSGWFARFLSDGFGFSHPPNGFAPVGKPAFTRKFRTSRSTGSRDMYP